MTLPWTPMGGTAKASHHLSPGLQLIEDPRWMVEGPITIDEDPRCGQEV